MIVSVTPLAIVNGPAANPLLFESIATLVFSSFSCTRIISPAPPAPSPRNLPPPRPDALTLLSADAEVSKTISVSPPAALFTSAFARVVLAPQAELLRPIPLASRTTAYLYVWIMRIATVGVLGFIISKMVTHPQNFGQRLAVDIVFAAIISGMVSIVILQSKEQFSSFIRGLGVGGIRNRIADIWHVLALIYVFVVFCVFSSGAQNGFIYLITATLITIFAVLGGLLLSFLFGRAIERIFRIEPSINEKFPGLKDRSNLYRPVMRRIVDVVIGICVLLICLSGWQINLYETIPPAIGAKIVKGSGTILFVFCLLYTSPSPRDS